MVRVSQSGKEGWIIRLSMSSLHDSSDFFVDRRKEPHCGEERVNLVLITTLRRYNTTRSLCSECLVGSVTRDLGRKGRLSREGADGAMDGWKRGHTSAPGV